MAWDIAKTWLGLRLFTVWPRRARVIATAGGTDLTAEQVRLLHGSR